MSVATVFLASALTWSLTAVIAAGALFGLLYWIPRDPDDGEEDGPPGGTPPLTPKPLPPEWDWERFEHEREAYEAGRLAGSR